MRPVLFIMLGGLLTLSGCVSLPLGPRVAVMPAPGKPFDLFVAEENACRQYAAQSVGRAPSQAAGESVATGAAAGAALGAATGAALGALSGHPGLGAAAGAGTGVLFGAAAGSNAAYETAGELQWRYDLAYEQCMYAKGNQVPGFTRPATPVLPPPPPPAGLPPP